MEYNRLVHCDCMDFMETMPDQSIDLTLTDIPYGEVNATDPRKSGARILDKATADVRTFCLANFLPQLYRVTRSGIIIFCGKGQFSTIYNYFGQHRGTVRALVWEKTNPSPFNGQHIYLSGVEFAVWFKKPGGVFNAFCKNTVFNYPAGTSKLHPTEKNHALLEDLIRDNTDSGDIVFDPCAGSGAHLLVAKQLGRRYLGCELHRSYFLTAAQRLLQTC